MAKKSAPREIPFAEIEAAFTLAPLGPHPAVDVMQRAGYYIRIQAGAPKVRVNATGTTIDHRYDYFYTDTDGVITTAPRGHAKDYKPGRITGLAEAVAKYAGGAR